MKIVMVTTNSNTTKAMIEHEDRVISKSQASDIIFREVYADESVTEKERSRATRARFMEELDMSAPCAGTYYQNSKSSIINGGDKFGHNKATNARARARTADPIVHERWRVVNAKTNEILKSFTSRTAAQTYNKELKAEGTAAKWVDGTKAA